MKNKFKFFSIIALVMLTGFSMVKGGDSDGGWDFDQELVGEWRFGDAITAHWVYNGATTVYSSVTKTATGGLVSVMNNDGTFSQIQFNGNIYPPGMPYVDLFCLKGIASTKNGKMRNTNMARYGNLPDPNGTGTSGTKIVPPDSEIYYRIIQEAGKTKMYISLTPNPGPGNHLGEPSIKVSP